MESPVSALSTAQLVTFLGTQGISRGGLDSVWEKEVTGSMLLEFCEEDIKDVFEEFKDRFHIRKLLRDFTDKTMSRLKSVTQTAQHLCKQVKEQAEPVSYDYSSSKQHISPNQDAVFLHPSSEYNLDHLSGTTGSMSVKNLPGRQIPEVTEPEVIEVKDESEKLFTAKRRRVDDMLSVPQVPAAHTHSYNVMQSTSGQGLGQHSVVENFVPPPPPISVFLNKSEFHPAFSTTHSRLTTGYHCTEEQKSSTFSGSTGEDQALCLKKSPPRIPSSPQKRNDTASPTTQPSSTTPDFLSAVETSHLDLASVMTMGQLASKYSAHEILSKKGQRSRPNGAQKLGSILIRNAAQQASLWSEPPHLRSISQRQRQEFLNSVYRIAPHIREYEHLLWQRLSETLQNRRKYLLDKRLGKRGFSSSCNSRTPSSSSHQDFPDFSEWQVTSVHSHLNSLEEDLRCDDVNILNEVVAVHACGDGRPIKKEPAS